MEQLNKLTRWFNKIVTKSIYKKVVLKYSNKKELEEIEHIEGFLKNCEVKVSDYTNSAMPTTIGLRISYGNKDFFFYEEGSEEVGSGVRVYKMGYDGSGIRV